MDGMYSMYRPGIWRGGSVLCVLVCVCIGGEEVEEGALLGEAERGEMTCCQSELTVTAQRFSAS